MWGFSKILQRNVSTMTVVGSGLMGNGIAQVSAMSGIEVQLVDLNEQLLSKAKKNIYSSLHRVAKKKHGDDLQAGVAFRDAIFNRIQVTTDLPKSVTNSDLVIEAIVEQVDIKQAMFAQIDKIAPEHCLFATNTSSLSVTEIGSKLSSNRKEKFGGLHFFNPVPMMKLLEVVQVDGMTSDETYNKFVDYGKKIGKTTVKCGDTPGFLVNRLLVQYLHEAIMLHERGHGTVEDIDTAMKLGAGYPMGPFELLDYVGLDLHKYIQQTWRGEPLSESKTINKLVAEGKFGRKTGEGFYKYK